MPVLGGEASEPADTVPIMQPGRVRGDAGTVARGLALRGFKGIVLPIDPIKEGRFDHRHHIVGTMLRLVGGGAHNKAPGQGPTFYGIYAHDHPRQQDL